MATLRTMQFRRTYSDWTASDLAEPGDMPCYDEASGTGSPGSVSIGSPASTSRPAEFCTPIRRSGSLDLCIQRQSAAGSHVPALSANVRALSSSRKFWKQLRSHLCCELFEHPNSSGHVVVSHMHDPQMEDTEMPLGHDLNQPSFA